MAPALSLSRRASRAGSNLGSSSPDDHPPLHDDGAIPAPEHRVASVAEGTCFGAACRQAANASVPRRKPYEAQVLSSRARRSSDVIVWHPVSRRPAAASVTALVTISLRPPERRHGAQAPSATRKDIAGGFGLYQSSCAHSAVTAICGFRCARERRRMPRQSSGDRRSARSAARRAPCSHPRRGRRTG